MITQVQKAARKMNKGERGLETMLSFTEGTLLYEIVKSFF
jgi:hypothetical protein